MAVSKRKKVAALKAHADRQQAEAKQLAGRAKLRGNKYYHRSQEGEYPHKDSGHLRRNIAMEQDLKTDAKNSTVRVGTNVPYGKELEFKMNRSFVRRTLLEERRMLGSIITQGKPL